MLYYKEWRKEFNKDYKHTLYVYRGWFLFGVIPLLIKRFTRPG